MIFLLALTVWVFWSLSSSLFLVSSPARCPQDFPQARYYPNNPVTTQLPLYQGMELHCLKLVMLLHTVQLVHSLKDFKTSSSSSGSNLDPLQQIVSMAATRQGHNVRAASVSSSELFTELEELVLPFLRSAVLFFQHFTDVAPGQDLVEDGGYTYEVLARWVLKSYGAV